MTRIYLAASYGRRAELAIYAEQLEDRGYTVTSRWLDGSHDDPSSTALKQYAQMDLDDIDAADWLVCQMETPEAGYMSGGRHCELGYAIAKGKRVYTIGHCRENIFHHLTTSFNTWEGFLAALKDGKTP